MKTTIHFNERKIKEVGVPKVISLWIAQLFAGGMIGLALAINSSMLLISGLVFTIFLLILSLLYYMEIEVIKQ